MTENTEFDWSDLAFASKKPVKELKAIFIAAPREISSKRFTALIKEYLPQTNIVLGLAKEAYIEGFEDQPQFKTLQLSVVKNVIEKVNQSTSKHKIYTLSYFQRELPVVVSKLAFTKVLLINGSWKYAFHNLPVYYQLVNDRTPFVLISPFIDELEAKNYEKNITKLLGESQDVPSSSLSPEALLQRAATIAKRSFDYSFQTGAVLARKQGKSYQVLLSAHNKVVPYETYALHHGASREIHFSPPHDLNHYDAVHAETEILIKAAVQSISFKDTTLCVNLMPCPTCARMLADTPIQEVLYQFDHSDGYAVKLLEHAGKKVRRILV